MTVRYVSHFMDFYFKVKVKFCGKPLIGPLIDYLCFTCRSRTFQVHVDTTNTGEECKSVLSYDLLTMKKNIKKKSFKR
jgi:hypothetical protein